MTGEKVSIRAAVGRGYGSFWNDRHRYRVVKGGRASKKSATMALWLIRHIMRYPLANALVVRQVYNTHKDSTFAALKWAARRLGQYDRWRFRESPLECVYRPTGQKILFRGFDDPLKLTSITVPRGVLCWVWIEEAFEIGSEADFRTLDETIRGEMPPGLWKQITLTFNPWSDTHWTKTRFFERTDPDAFTLTTTYRCNEWLDAADRRLIETLERTDPDRYRVVGLGEYGIPGGAYFPEFRAGIHTCAPFPIPAHWKRYVSLDYGLDMLACLWIALDEEGNAFVYRELYESGLIISEAARRILGAEGPDHICARYAPPDLWSRRQETGRSAADIFRESGVTLRRSSNDREAGWLSVKEWLRVGQERDPFTGEARRTSRLQIFGTCANLVRCLPQLRTDAREPNKADGEHGTPRHELTHAPDALRYFCVMRHRPSEPAPKSGRDYFRERLGDYPADGEVPESYINMKVAGYK